MIKSNADKINSIIAHDLKDSLASISGITDILIGNWNDFPEKEKLEILQEIRESSDSTMRLLTDLLDWNRRTNGNVEPDKRSFDAENTIKTAIGHLKQQLKRKKVEINNHVLASLFIFGDENMFAAVMRNLLANAIKSCVNGGIIDISAKRDVSSCTFSISDNGIGMAKSRIEQLFPADTTPAGHVAKGYSNSFGLILCRDFITLNKGRLWAESEQGRGTMVSFTFPVPSNQQLQ